MNAVVFLGPSLPMADARAIVDATYLPPAQQSDILSAIEAYQPAAIGLIDGAFGQVLSVWHKEILYALDRGIHVYGASSMGALRAAETDAFGMVGVGDVYQMYASGELTDDDEVALIHAQDDSGYRPLSDAMVNIRLTLRRAREAGVIDAPLHDRLVALGKEMFFADRTFRGLCHAARASGLDARAIGGLESYLAAGGIVDAKRADAIALLTTLRDLPDPLPPHEPRFEFRRSSQFVALYERDRRVPHAGVEIPMAAIASHAALHLPDFTTRNAHALNRALVGVLGDLLSIDASDEQIDGEATRFRLERRITDDLAFAAWLRGNDLRSAEFRVMMREMAVARRLHAWLSTRKGGERTVKFVLDELRYSGDYETIARQAAAEQQILAPCETDVHDRDARAGETIGLVLDHIRATGCRMATSFQVWAEEVGFQRTEDLRLELVRARMAREIAAETTRHVASALVPA